MAGATYQKKVRCCTVLGSHLTCDHLKATSIIQRALPEPTQSTAGPAVHHNTEWAAAFASVRQLELWSGTAGCCLISPSALELPPPYIPACGSWDQPLVAGHRLCTKWCRTPESSALVAQVQALLYLTPPQLSWWWYFLSSCNATTLPSLSA